MAAPRYNSLGSNDTDDPDSMELSESGHENAKGTKKPEPKSFDPAEQTRRLFKEQGFRLATTIILIVLVIAALKVFENRGNVSKIGKRLFNFVITGLSLLLGLGFFDAFKDMAKVLRWRILANHDFSLRETDLILSGDSLMKLTTLMKESWKKPRTLFVCGTWIFLNIAAQAAIGMIGLTYSMENGIDSRGITTSSGTIHAARLDCYYVNDTCITSDGSDRGEISAQTLAHSYGETTKNRVRCQYTKESEIRSAPQNCSHFYHKNGQEFAIRYAEYNPDDVARAYPYFTDRIVKAFAGECSQYDVAPNPSSADSQDGKEDTWVWKISNSTSNDTISIPKREAAIAATTYIYYGTASPPKATVQSCGARCLWVYAWRSRGDYVNRSDSGVIRCPITISEVTNAGKDWQVLPNNVARYAAGSIALTGRPAPNWQQYRLYPYGSPWETGNLDASGVGAMMSEFAIGSLASMANLNPQLKQQGTLPVLAFSLSVKWVYVIILAVCIVCAHCILVALMLWIARSVVVAHDSHLCMARVLYGLVGRLAPRGSLLGEKEIVTAIQGPKTRELRVKYGIEKTEQREGEMLLKVGEKKDLQAMKKWSKFPSGPYS
ncbi:hypothetical protein MMC29_005849 [Sticta canariensis]|nr:hypothetical protein [Sticta canariensis]